MRIDATPRRPAASSAADRDVEGRWEKTHTIDSPSANRLGLTTLLATAAALHGGLVDSPAWAEPPCFAEPVVSAKQDGCAAHVEGVALSVPPTGIRSSVTSSTSGPLPIGSVKPAATSRVLTGVISHSGGPPASWACWGNACASRRSGIVSR